MHWGDIPPDRNLAIPGSRARLDSWKEIAAYLKRSPRTARRWERKEGLPVHRHLHNKQATIYAFSQEIDTWLKGRDVKESPDRSTLGALPESSPRPAAGSGQNAPGTRPIMIALLPFLDFSCHPALEQFIEGLSEEIISKIDRSTSNQIRVIALSDVIQNGHLGKSVEQIGRELGAEYILGGRVRRNKRGVRLTARLIAAADKTPIWGESYEIEFPPNFSVQRGLAQRLAGSLCAKLPATPKERRRQATGPIVAAHDAYLARVGHFGWSEAETKMTMEYLSQAAEGVPDCAAAYAELALTYYRLGLLYDYPPISMFRSGKELALRALGLDPTLARAHAMLALFSLFHAWDWREAEASSRLAMGLDPSDARPRIIRAAYYLVMEKREDAIEELKQAQRIDPHSLIVNGSLAILAYYARRWDLVSESCQELLRRDSAVDLARVLLGVCYARKGHHERALSYFRKARDLGTSGTLQSVGLCSAYAVTGERESAQRLLQELVAAKDKQYVRYFYLAYASAGLESNEQTLGWLEMAYEQRDPLLVFLKIDPRFDPLSGSKRFRELLRRIGLAQ